MRRPPPTAPAHGPGSGLGTRPRAELTGLRCHGHRRLSPGQGRGRGEAGPSPTPRGRTARDMRPGTRSSSLLREGDGTGTPGLVCGLMRSEAWRSSCDKASDAGRALPAFPRLSDHPWLPAPTPAAKGSTGPAGLMPRWLWLRDHRVPAPSPAPGWSSRVALGRREGTRSWGRPGAAFPRAMVRQRPWVRRSSIPAARSGPESKRQTPELPWRSSFIMKPRTKCSVCPGTLQNISSK